jgi:4a-hydroxytetrahydrobiopterin dehydratase
MPRLDDTAIEEGLQRLPGWQRRGNQIVKTFTRADFAQAMAFVNQVAGAAEAAGHHPDIDIRWNKVTLALSSHSEGGLTERDFQLAARIQELAILVGPRVGALYRPAAAGPDWRGQPAGGDLAHHPRAASACRQGW